MSTLPSVTEATTRRPSSFPTYFATRIVLALLLTGFDALVFLKSALVGLRDSLGMPLLHWLLIVAVAGIALRSRMCGTRRSATTNPLDPTPATHSSN
jgi:hypothetical protein